MSNRSSGMCAVGDSLHDRFSKLLLPLAWNRERELCIINTLLYPCVSHVLGERGLQIRHPRCMHERVMMRLLWLQLDAAWMAASAGVTTVIASGKEKDGVLQVNAGNAVAGGFFYIQKRWRCVLVII